MKIYQLPALMILCVAAAKGAYYFRGTSLNAVEAKRALRGHLGYADDGRPVIFTFYSPLEKYIGATGMSSDADKMMLDLWAKTWRELGWDARVLTIEHSKMHPGFTEYYEKLQEVPIGEYDQLCYLRWLAVAVSGGGWMSDYDVLPMSNFDHTFDRFTVYDNMGGRGMPYLASGTNMEWHKLAHALLEGGLKHKEEKLWSDMFALMYDAEGLYDLGPKRVVSAEFVLTREPVDCKVARQFNAIHFCQICLKNSVLQEGETISDRPKTATRLLNEIHERCGSDIGIDVKVEALD